MDFIKTSSLRALIELTFQRNWNGLIWMSRKGVITKRVKTVQTALSRISAQPRSPAGRGTMFRARPKLHNRHATPRTTSARAGKKPRGRATRLTYAHERSVRAGNYARVRPRISSAKLIRPTTPADHESVRPRPFRLGHDPTVRPIVPTDRPNAAVDPKPVLKPDFIFSSPA
ncbi:unnamed protein product [Microthlaspi erraticum]|uniref:Uncharacterized protein n=1 Tax=Microthlaspi erraticum TaxID=1685480 RepID=A0A6D2KTT7_9BRAS|nr:unnamed protein product [Microthlaspi erraticum]